MTYEDAPEGWFDGVKEDDDLGSEDIDDDDLEDYLYKEGYNTEENDYTEEDFDYTEEDYDEEDYFEDEAYTAFVENNISESGYNIKEDGYSEEKYASGDLYIDFLDYNYLEDYYEEGILDIKSYGIKVFKPNKNLLPLIGFYLFDYIPGRFEQDIYSKNIILVKKKDPTTIEHFSNILFEILNKKWRVTICAVPSSDSKNTDTGTSKIVKYLCLENSSENNPWINGANLIKRIKSIPRKHLKERYPLFEEEYNSLEITNPKKIKGENILLLDDVSSKGQAIKATAKKLYEAGAKRVIVITLGKTIFKKK